MPTSLLALAPEIVRLTWEVQPKNVLDIGPGWGKYGLLLRENFPRDHFVRIDAVEMEPSYIDGRQGAGLMGIYDELFDIDATLLPPEFFAGYDFVLMADVIEHMERDAALDLLARIPGRMLISTPVEFFHNGDGLPESETHRSHWTVEDFGDRVEVDASQMGAVLVRLAPLS